MMMETISYINRLPVQGVKMSMLHILKNTPLGESYLKTPFPLFNMEEYTDCIVDCIEALRPDIVIERMTGDGPRRLLIAPLWTLDKRRVLNTIHQKLALKDSRQGQYMNATRMTAYTGAT